MNRFYHSKPLSINQAVILDDFSGHHALKVLRVRLNDDLVLFNGDGYDYKGRVTEINKKEIEITILTSAKKNRESPLKICLIQSLSSNEKMDWIIQKATELGAYEIQPIFSERSIIKISQDRIIKKLAHWKQVSISACEQCYRTEVPQIHQPKKFMDYLNNTSFEDNALRLILAPSARINANIFPTKEPNKVYVLIGPEGGFDKKEIQLANSLNFEAINLGPRILRTETAPLSILSILQYKYGDFA
jgi:16S rRNA (uracil1498-N3)-methyltransferase